MKRILALCLITFTMALVVNTTSHVDKYSLDEAYQIENCDVISINDVDFTIAKTVFTPNYIAEVGILPPYSCEGVYYSEFSRNSDISNDDTYALIYNYDNSIEAELCDMLFHTTRYEQLNDIFINYNVSE